MSRRKATLAELRKALVAVVGGFDALARSGDDISAATVRSLRAALLVDTTARRRPDVSTRCSSCDARVPPCRERKRPGGTAVHYAGARRCPGSDLPFCAHDEIRAERKIAKAAARVPVVALLGLFGPVEEGRA